MRNIFRVLVALLFVCIGAQAFAQAVISLPTGQYASVSLGSHVHILQADKHQLALGSIKNFLYLLPASGDSTVDGLSQAGYSDGDTLEIFNTSIADNVILPNDAADYGNEFNNPGSTVTIAPLSSATYQRTGGKWAYVIGGFAPGSSGLAANSETATYVANIAAAGGSIDTATVGAVDQFVTSLKTAGVWSSIQDMGIFAGSNLAAGLVKLKYTTASGSSLINHGMVSGDYSQRTGIDNTTAYTTTVKWLDTGFVPNANGDSTTNFSVGYFPTNQMVDGGGGYSFSSNPASGDTALTAQPGFIGIVTGFAIQTPLNGAYVNTISYGSGTSSAYINGVAAANTSSPITFDVSSNWTLGKTTRNGTVYYTQAGSGFYFLGGAMTTTQMNALGDAVLILERALGRISQTMPQVANVGDSITAGVGTTANDPGNTWVSRMDKRVAAQQVNFGIPGSAASAQISTTYGLNTTGPQILAVPGIDGYTILLGTNDFNLIDATNTGNSTVQAAWAAAMTPFIQGIRAAGKKVLLATIPYNTSNANSVAAKFQSWNAYIANFAGTWQDGGITAPIQLVDFYTGMIAQGSAYANSLLYSDQTHPNDAGHALLGQMAGDAWNGAYSIVATLTVGAISANQYADVTQTVYGAYVGQEVKAALQTNVAGCTVSAFVSGTNTVTVRFATAQTAYAGGTPTVKLTLNLP